MNFQTKNSRLKLQNGFDISGTTTSTSLFVGDVSNSSFTLDVSGEVYLRTSKVKIGEDAGLSNQGDFSVAIGSQAGRANQASLAVSIGYGAGYTSQGSKSIAIGYQAGYCNQDISSVAIGANAGYINQRENTVAIGQNAGYTQQGSGSIAIGSRAGQRTQGVASVAIGVGAGQSDQSNNCVAVGIFSGQTSQRDGAIAIGNSAGRITQGINAISIGAQSGNASQGSAAIAIGVQAGQTGQGNNSIAIGTNAGQTDQHANSIIINATGTVQNSATANACYINPIRNATQTYILGYDAESSKEITYFVPSSGTTMNWTTRLTNQTLTGDTSRNIFNTTGDTYAITPGTWFFNFFVSFLEMSGIAGTISFELSGNSVISSIMYRGTTNTSSGGSVDGVSASTSSFIRTTRNSSIVTPSFTDTNCSFQGEGIIRVSTGGTLIPRVIGSSGKFGSGSILQNSYFILWQGSTSNTTEFVGNWS